MFSLEFMRIQEARTSINAPQYLSVRWTSEFTVLIQLLLFNI